MGAVINSVENIVERCLPTSENWHTCSAPDDDEGIVRKFESEEGKGTTFTVTLPQTAE